MMGKIKLSILGLLLAITGATCLRDQLVLQKLPLTEPTNPTRLHSQGAETQVPVTEATAYNPSVPTKPPVITSPLPILVTNQLHEVPTPSTPWRRPSSPPHPPAPSTLCHIDACQLDPCTGLVIGGGLVAGHLVMETCCPARVGLATLEAQLCLCTSFGSGLGIITLQVDPVKGVLEACGRIAPPGPLCFI